MGPPPFTPRAKKVMELALRESLQLGHNSIGTEHLLLGVVREAEGVGAQVLVSLGADLPRVRQRVIEVLAGYEGEEETAKSPSSGVGHVVHRHRDLEHSARFIGCQFCERKPPETGRLVAAGNAVICEHCIELWHTRLSQPDQLHGPTPRPLIIEPVGEDDSEGPGQ